MSASFMHQPINILLVEDDDIDVMTLKRKFKKGNINNPIYHAASGVEALKILRGEDETQKPNGPVIMLTDVNLPRMNGLELLKELRSDDKLKESIVFMLTTSPRDEDVISAYRLNVAGYFLKENLDQMIEMLRMYWQINEFPQALNTPCPDSNSSLGQA